MVVNSQLQTLVALVGCALHGDHNNNVVSTTMLTIHVLSHVLTLVLTTINNSILHGEQSLPRMAHVQL